MQCTEKYILLNNYSYFKDCPYSYLFVIVCLIDYFYNNTVYLGFKVFTSFLLRQETGKDKTRWKLRKHMYNERIIKHQWFLPWTGEGRAGEGRQVRPARVTWPSVAVGEQLGFWQSWFTRGLPVSLGGPRVHLVVILPTDALATPCRVSRTWWRQNTLRGWVAEFL